MKKAHDTKKKKNPVIIILSIFMIILICGAFVYFYLHQSDNEIDASSEAIVEESEVETENIDQTYITETCYDGSQEVNPILYSIPFDTGEEKYIKNKDIVKEISEDEILLLQEKAEECVQLLFGTNDNIVLTDYDGIEIDMSNLFQKEASWHDENDTDTTVKLYVADYLKALADNNYKAVCKYQTDKSLIWFNNNYFIRGLVQLDVQECKDGNALSNYFSVAFETGKSYQIIVDFGFTLDAVNGTREYVLTGIEYKLVEESQEAFSDPEVLEIKG